MAQGEIVLPGRLGMLLASHGQVVRYGLAITGPMAVAASQFLVSLAMMHLLSPRDFGGFSFLMVANVLSWGICSALVVAPMPVILYQKVEGLKGDGEAMLVNASACFAVVAAAIIAALAWRLDIGGIRLVLFTAYGWASFSRYFARSHALARHRQLPATASDILFALTLTCGLGIAMLYPSAGGTIVYGALLASALAGLLPFGIGYIVGKLLLIRIGALKGYGLIWRRMSSWSVLGVVTTEATNNAHAYLVTSLLGPAAFAPLAASMLVTRPVSVISTALSDFERPRLAKHIGEGDFGALRRTLRQFSIAIAGAWVLTAILVLAIFLFAPNLLFPPRYETSYLAIGATLWMLVAAARMAAIPSSCTLIAKGSFRLLANSSLISAIVTIALVAILITTTDTIWSIVGLLAGQICYAIIIQVQASRWLAKQS